MSDSLTHYGVTGMKWGVRRYQNTDGSLTTAGKKRYRSPVDIIKLKEKSDKKQKSKKSPEQLESEFQKKQDVKNRGVLTNDQLKAKIERLKLEKELKDLTSSEIRPGQKFVEDVLKSVGKKTLETALSGAALYGLKASVSQEFNKKDFAEAIFNGGAKKK